MDCEIYRPSILIIIIIIIINFQLFSQNKTRPRVKSRLKGLTYEKTCILLTDKENIENEEKVNLFRCLAVHAK